MTTDKGLGFESPLPSRAEKVVKKMAEGFRFLENRVFPAAMDPGGGIYLPSGGSHRELLQEQYMERLGELRGLYGQDNVWVGPRLAETPPRSCYSEAEHVGFYVRDKIS